jgi:CDP-glucose 4,6-dehydratase
VEKPAVTPSFWNGRRVLLTGHTGFKGAWASLMLADYGANVTAFSLPPQSQPNLWQLIQNRVPIACETVDLRDAAAVATICHAVQPEIVLHMAAQAQVRDGYRDPVETFSANVMGTVNLLEGLRRSAPPMAVLVVTSDKVYANSEDGAPFAECSPLGGSDPYSASKAATEIVVRSYAESYFESCGVPLATARGGNVVGGGDFSSDRLVPDVYRAARTGTPVELRYPSATRPWQHVLDCLAGYFTYAEYLVGRTSAEPSALNFGPISEPQMSVAQVAEAIGEKLGNKHPWRKAAGAFPPEKKQLRLDSRLATRTLGWFPKLDLAGTIDWTAEWYAAFADGKDPLELMLLQLARYRV